METISIKHRDKGLTKYEIYTVKEMDRLGKVYVPWQNAEIGDWAWSDDGYCAKVINRKVYPNNHGQTSTYIRLPWGYFLWNPKYPTIKFNVKGRMTPYTISGRPQLEVKKKSEKMKNLAMAYAQTMNKDLAIDLAFGSLTDSQHGMWKRRMKSEVFRDMVREELQELLTKHGMTEDYTLDLLDETIQTAKGKNDVTNLMRAVENLQDMHGMKDKGKMKTTTQIEGTVTRKLLDKIQEEERKLIATETIEENGVSNA